MELFLALFEVRHSMINRLRPISLIVAATENNVIGRDNQMPWHLPNELQYFKATTMGKPIIMGRKTWDSLGRPLPGRLNIVVSRQADLNLQGAEVFNQLEHALERAQQWAVEHAADEVMVIGGEQLYRLALTKAQRVYLTRIALRLEGDAFFPALEQPWQCIQRKPQPGDGDSPAYCYEIWEKLSASN